MIKRPNGFMDSTSAFDCVISGCKFGHDMQPLSGTCGSTCNHLAGFVTPPGGNPRKFPGVPYPGKMGFRSKIKNLPLFNNSTCSAKSDGRSRMVHGNGKREGKQKPISSEKIFKETKIY